MSVISDILDANKAMLEAERRGVMEIGSAGLKVEVSPNSGRIHISETLSGVGTKTIALSPSNAERIAKFILSLVQ